MTLTANEHLRAGYALLKLTHEQPLPKMYPGQFAELKVDGSETTFLRRPISVNYVDEEKNEVWFLIHEIGDGTRNWGISGSRRQTQCGYALRERFYDAFIR